MIGHAGDDPERLLKAAVYLGISPEVAAEFIAAHREAME